MRYLLTVILVLALASPAWSICNSTPRELLDVDDTDRMPVTSSHYDIEECNTFDWTFDLDFTHVGGRTIVYGIVIGSDVNQSVDSDLYWQDQTIELDGSGNFSGAASQYWLKIDIDDIHNDTGHFSNMDLRVFNQSK